MTKSAFLFPGQGSQSVGMIDGLAEQFPEVKETFTQASDVLGTNLWALAHEGPAETLNQTEITQPALLATGIATWRAWQSVGGPVPDVLAGHSLGEYTALVAAGRIAFEDGIALVAERGRLMQAAVPPGTGAMAAIIRLDDDTLESACEQAAQGQVVSCANYNSPGQVVIAGDKEAVDRACVLAKEAGARAAMPLEVSVPSHCALMKPAADKLSALLSEIAIEDDGLPVVQNVDSCVHAEAGEIRNALVAQLWQPVRWSAGIEAMMAMGAGRFYECGPGKVLTGLNRRISREIESTALISTDALTAAVENWS